MAQFLAVAMCPCANPGRFQLDHLANLMLLVVCFFFMNLLTLIPVCWFVKIGSTIYRTTIHFICYRKSFTNAHYGCHINFTSLATCRFGHQFVALIVLEGVRMCSDVLPKVRVFGRVMLMLPILDHRL